MAIALAIICMMVVAGGTFAYYTTSDVAKSTVTASNLKVELVMLEDDGTGNQAMVSGSTTILPGETKSRIAKVKNVGKEPAWIRMRADLVVGDETFSAMETPYSHLEGLDIDTNWTWNEKDGYFYYNKALNPGETTEALFTAVTFRADSINNDNGKNINLKVDAEGTQTKHNGNTALEAEGWPAE